MDIQLQTRHMASRGGSNQQSAVVQQLQRVQVVLVDTQDSCRRPAVRYSQLNMASELQLLCKDSSQHPLQAPGTLPYPMSGLPGGCFHIHIDPVHVKQLPPTHLFTDAIDSSCARSCIQRLTLCSWWTNTHARQLKPVQGHTQLQ